MLCVKKILKYRSTFLNLHAQVNELRRTGKSLEMLV